MAHRQATWSGPKRVMLLPGCVFLLVLLTLLLCVQLRKLPPDYRRDEAVVAAGRLRLLRKSSGEPSLDRRAIRDEVKRLEAAAVAVVPEVSGEAPRAIEDDRADHDTPSLPAPPTDVVRHHTIYGAEYRMRVGPTALRVCGSFAPDDVSPDPVVLTANHRVGQRTFHIEHALLRSASVDEIDGIAYGGGSGVLIIIAGRYEALANGGSMGKSRVYRAEAPQWTPVSLPVSLMWPSHKAGQTAAGDHVYFISGDGVRSAKLWDFDNAKHTVKEIGLSGVLRSGALVPSPQLTFLASRTSAPMQRRTRRPLQIVDIRDGRVYDLTSRVRGDFADSAIAWSSRAPNRLYFADAFMNLYELDFDLSKALPNDRVGRE